MTATLITRETSDLLGTASAVLSEDGTYRYLLTRIWGSRPYATWVMLNPSKADEAVNDPTIGRCITFTRAWELGGLTVVNLYALRSTDPAALSVHPDPVGPDNDRIIAENCRSPQMVIAAWGAGFRGQDRPAKVAGIFAAAGQQMLCLGVTKDGHPRHPLYVPGSTMPVPYEIPGSSS